MTLVYSFLKQYQEQFYHQGLDEEELREYEALKA
jgi:hypothetical protein